MFARNLFVLVWAAAFIAGCSHEARPRFVRYIGEQPPTDVRLLPQSANANAIENVVRQAKTFAKLSEGYWPEPSGVDERDDVWCVKFAEKERLVMIGGKEETEIDIPGGRTVEVRKEDLSCRFYPVR